MKEDGDTLLSLDILGAKNDVVSDNCILKLNQTEIIGRGNLDYIISVRNEMLSNRGYRIPEIWDHEWNHKLGPIWTPDSISANLETWACPEYFKPETDNPTKCIEMTNRVNNDVAFEQTTITKMPSLERARNLRNHEGLVFNGTTEFMRGNANEDWQVDTSDFIIAVVIAPNNTMAAAAPIVAKRSTQFALKVDYSSTNEDVIFTMNGTDYTLIDGAVLGEQVIVCGRKDGKAFVYTNGNQTEALSADTADLDHNSKPWLADMMLNNQEYKGTVYEIIMVNDELSETTTVDDDLVEKLTGYLAWKYNLAKVLESGHTYKNAPPRTTLI